jgi:hypothetical protein
MTEPNRSKVVAISKVERRMILDWLYDRLAALDKKYKSPETARPLQRRIRTERRSLAVLINKLEGATAVKIPVYDDIQEKTTARDLDGSA